MTIRIRRHCQILIIVAIALCANRKALCSTELTPNTPYHNDVLLTFGEFDDRLCEFYVVDGRSITADYSLTLIQATGPSRLRPKAFGIFVINNRTDSLHMTIDIFDAVHPGGMIQYQAVIEHVNEQYLSVVRESASNGKLLDRIKYIYNLEQAEILNKVEHWGMGIYSIFPFGKSLFFLASDRMQTVIARLKSPHDYNNAQNWEIIDEIEGKNIHKIHSARRKGDMLGLKSDSVEYQFSRDVWRNAGARRRDFAVPLPIVDTLGTVSTVYHNSWIPLSEWRDSLLLTESDREIGEMFGVWNCKYMVRERPSGIYDIADEEDGFYDFPNPDYELFSEYRPERVSEGYSRDHTEIQTAIGPYQLLDGKIWFGTTFYDAEGVTGLGAIGYFDTRGKEYHTDYPEEVVDWSSSSIYVDRRHVWLGLARTSEYYRYPGGLIRYDVKKRTIKKYNIRRIINQIHKFGDNVYLGTTDGIYVVSGDEITYIGFDFDIDGKYYLYFKKT